MERWRQQLKGIRDVEKTNGNNIRAENGTRHSTDYKWRAGKRRIKI